MKVGDVALVVDEKFGHCFPIGALVVIEDIIGTSISAYGLDGYETEDLWSMQDSELLYIGKL